MTLSAAGGRRGPILVKMEGSKQTLDLCWPAAPPPPQKNGFENVMPNALTRSSTGGYENLSAAEGRPGPLLVKMGGQKQALDPCRPAPGSHQAVER